MSLKDQILAAAIANKNKLEPTLAWGVACNIRVMTGTERDQFEGQVYNDGKMVKEQFRAKLVVKTLSDDQGDRVFTEDDIVQLSEMDSRELDRLYTLAAKVNGLTKQDVDELTKNS
jgi:hypothetical protein